MKHYNYKKVILSLLVTLDIQKVVDKTRSEDAGTCPYDQPGYGILLIATK